MKKLSVLFSIHRYQGKGFNQSSSRILPYKSRNYIKSFLYEGIGILIKGPRGVEDFRASWSFLRPIWISDVQNPQTPPRIFFGSFEYETHRTKIFWILKENIFLFWQRKSFITFASLPSQFQRLCKFIGMCFDFLLFSLVFRSDDTNTEHHTHIAMSNLVASARYRRCKRDSATWTYGNKRSVCTHESNMLNGSRCVLGIKGSWLHFRPWVFVLCVLGAFMSHTALTLTLTLSRTHREMSMNTACWTGTQLSWAEREEKKRIENARSLTDMVWNFGFENEWVSDESA